MGFAPSFDPGGGEHADDRLKPDRCRAGLHSGGALAPARSARAPAAPRARWTRPACHLRRAGAAAFERTRTRHPRDFRWATHTPRATATTVSRWRGRVAP